MAALLKVDPSGITGHRAKRKPEPSERWCERHRLRSATGLCCNKASVTAWTMPDNAKKVPRPE